MLDQFHFEINYAIAHKGGTAIMINKRTPFTVLTCEKSANSRIMSLRIKLFDQIFNFVNIYAHSGDAQSKEREELFSSEILYYLRNSLQNTIIGGDFNCVLSDRDTESENVRISKALLNTVRTLQLKDLWFSKNRQVEYTYIRNNHGSRIDRLYGKEMYNNVVEIKRVNVSFSDHSCILSRFECENIPKVGKYYWKLNTSLLELEDIDTLFKIEWDRIKTSKNNYKNINEWWDKYAKKEIKSFFIKTSKREAQNKYGLLKYLEYCLNRKYNELNLSGNIDYSEIKNLKDRINSIQTEILEGVRVRSRVEE